MLGDSLASAGSNYPTPTLCGVDAILPHCNITQYLETKMIVLIFSTEIAGKAPGPSLHRVTDKNNSIDLQ